MKLSGQLNYFKLVNYLMQFMAMTRHGAEPLLKSILKITNINNQLKNELIKIKNG